MLKAHLSHKVDAFIQLMRPFIFRPSSPATSYSVLILAIFVWTLWGPCAHAQSITDRLTGSPKVPWQISADTVAYDAKSTTYHARGNVIIEKQAARLVADVVSFNHKAMTASAAGHVVMTVGDDILTGERLELNLNQETGVVHGGTVFLKENHFYIHGERIEKTGKDTYRAEKGSITSCDGDRPDWIITGRTLKVTIEGYGSATHAVLRARGVPVLYTPYILFPAKTKRQTGLLFPEAGYSDRKGFAWDQPLFWAISDSTDATLYTHYMQERGAKIGLEYRYALTDASFGAIMADGLQDRKIDDGTPDNTIKWGYADDAYDRPNTDRYWLRSKLDQELPWGALARLDLDIVSDQDYLTEFKDGRSGFNETRDYFLEAFGRDLDTYDESTRTNRLNINRTWSKFTLNGDLLWNDNVTNRRWEASDDTLQKLPVIEFNGAKQQAIDTGVYWDLDSEYTYFYREDGQRGHRTDLYPRVYLPLKWKNYLSLEPSTGWRQTAWVMDRWEDDTLDHSTYRQIYDARLDLSTEFSKVMGSPVAAVDRIRHSVKPQVIYEYIPDQDQSDLPFFTDLDRIDEKNRVTYSLTNTFTARTAKNARSSTTTGDGAFFTEEERLPDRMLADPPAPAPFDYNRFCRFYLEQSYDIAAAREDLPEPFSDIYGELDFNLGRYFIMDTDARYNTYDARFSTHNVGAAVVDHRGDRLWMEHRYEKDAYESIRGTLSVKITDHLTARGEYERNLLDERDIIKGAGFLYTAQCWSVDFFYAVEGADNKFSFFINLMGIGGFGQ
ncbi:MAG: LPS-assembly protein LptD [Desulfosarcina sp.]|nr:LPS-assembly protein LptD [Desulfosarcina sp.]MBC2742042.1 LPS-assembly protein LptD [Desulfosarcina sp.]MBC2764955.1 LPS-assembly protein LptD [Desulfosarcina sp.]